jgi:formamidopyrimidine-DNA glycosylase
MPELPDIAVYVESLERRILGSELRTIRLFRPFLLRTVDPSIEAAEGRSVVALRRVGKRIAIGLAGDLWLVVHLMIAGRLRWREAGAKSPGKIGLAAFDFSTGTLLLTEAGTKRRAALHVVRGEAGLRMLHAGGVEVLGFPVEEFTAALRRENHTLKRSLTDPRLFSGIGNSYSDEILFRARLSPFKQTQQLAEEGIERLYAAVQTVLTEWTERLRREAGDGFPEKVTAFHDEMCVHGRYGQPCRECGAPVQRIVYAENEANYCARCQTAGRLLADRALSRLLKGDWPKTIEELEEGKKARARPTA